MSRITQAWHDPYRPASCSPNGSAVLRQRDMGYGWKARKTEERGSQSRLRDKGGRLCTECCSWMTKRSRVRVALDLRLGEIRLPACGRGLEWTAGHEVDRKRGFGHSDHGYRDAGHGRVGTDPSDKGALSLGKGTPLSCHSDFEYVREGIRLGASDYILKPTLDADSLVAVLDHMRLKLEEEKQMRGF